MLVSLTQLFYGRRATPGKNRRGSRDGWEARKAQSHNGSQAGAAATKEAFKIILTLFYTLHFWKGINLLLKIMPQNIFMVKNPVLCILSQLLS